MKRYACYARSYASVTHRKVTKPQVNNGVLRMLRTNYYSRKNNTYRGNRTGGNKNMMEVRKLRNMRNMRNAPPSTCENTPKNTSMVAHTCVTGCVTGMVVGRSSDMTMP